MDAGFEFVDRDSACYVWILFEKRIRHGNSILSIAEKSSRIGCFEFHSDRLAWLEGAVERCGRGDSQTRLPNDERLPNGGRVCIGEPARRRSIVDVSVKLLDDCAVPHLIK